MTSRIGTHVQKFRSGEPGKLGVLMATAFVDMVGALIIIPLLPFYAKHFGASDFMVMVLVSAFSAMQLISAPLWGRVSDRYGRKPALLIGLGASAIAYVVFAYADSYWLLLLSRAVQGAGGGTTAVIQAYVTDSVEPRNRAKGLGWLSAATNAGVVLGPAIGSWSQGFNNHAPGLVAAVLCVLNVLFAARFLAESRVVTAADRAQHKPSTKTWPAVLRVATWRHIGDPPSRLIWMYSIGIGAWYGVNALLTLYLGRAFNVTAESIGPFYSYIGALNIVFRLLVLGWAVDTLGEMRTARFGATALALGLAVIPFTAPVHIPHLTYITIGFALALIPLGTALNFPCVTATLSRVVRDDDRGLYLGVQQTYGGLARVLYPLAAGAASDHFGVGAPFWLSALLVASTILMGGNLARYTRDTGEHPVPLPVAAEAAKEAPVIAE
ncbi:MAG TPA: MFS transporter [Gemmatimonadaceae bacterium]|nr:MFS transporter [Gemmatimonadaceae bacterium]